MKHMWSCSVWPARPFHVTGLFHTCIRPQLLMPMKMSDTSNPLTLSVYSRVVVIQGRVCEGAERIHLRRDASPVGNRQQKVTGGRDGQQAKDRRAEEEQQTWHQPPDDPRRTAPRCEGGRRGAEEAGETASPAEGREKGTLRDVVAEIFFTMCLGRLRVR